MRRPADAIALALALALTAVSGAEAQQAGVSAAAYQQLTWRMISPFRASRTVPRRRRPSRERLAALDATLGEWECVRGRKP